MKKFSSYLISAFMLVSSSASAGSFVLNDYNVVTIEDLNFSSNIYGKTFVGGDLNTPNSANFGDRVDQPYIDATLQVAGDVNISSTISVKGSMEVGDTNNIWTESNQVKVNGNYVNNTTGVSINTELTDLKAQYKAELESASSAFASLETNTNNTITTSNEGKKVTLSVDQTLGANDYAVFNLDNIHEVFTNKQNLEIEMQANNINNIAGVIINVSGDNIELANSANINGSIFNNNQSQILWNFMDATSINLASQKFFGSILAPFATLTTGNDIDGSVGVYSIANSRQIHNFETTVTPPVVSVPAPNALFLLSVMTLIAGFRRYSR